jgi:hypothetical protein
MTLGKTINNYRTSGLIGEKHPRAKLTQRQVDEIRQKAAEGVPRAQLMSDYNIKSSALSDLLSGKTWRTNPSIL